MNILLAVTGSISAYKAYDLCRELSKKGHRLKVILSAGALKFIRPETFRYLGAIETFTPKDDFNVEALGENQNILHIELARWAERFVIAPLSANTLSDLAHGKASDLLTTTALAYEKRDIIAFLAMNTSMLNHPATQRNRKVFESDGAFLYPTSSGEMACGEIGEGKLPPVEEILVAIESYTKKRSGKKLLLTTGSSIAPLDDIRFVTNPSSGKTGVELAIQFYSQGHDVDILCGENSDPRLEAFDKLPGARLFRLKTTDDFYSKAKELFQDSHYYISSAALSDLTFERASEKIKKENLFKSLNVQKAKDVLFEMIKLRNQQVIIGFSAETNNLIENMKEKIDRKPCDYLVGNLVSTDRKIGFNQESNDYLIMNKSKEVIFNGLLSKRELSIKLQDLCSK